jgi:hypothetical protein
VAHVDNIARSRLLADRVVKKCHPSQFVAPGKSREPAPDLEPERAFGRGLAARAQVIELFIRKSFEIAGRKDRGVLPEQDVRDRRSPVRELGQQHHLGPSSRFAHREVAAGIATIWGLEPRHFRSGMGRGGLRAGSHGQAALSTRQLQAITSARIMQEPSEIADTARSEPFPRCPDDGQRPGSNPALSARHLSGPDRSSMSDRVLSTSRPGCHDVARPRSPGERARSHPVQRDRGGTAAGGSKPPTPGLRPGDHRGRLRPPLLVLWLLAATRHHTGHVCRLQRTA